MSPCRLYGRAGGRRRAPEIRLWRQHDVHRACLHGKKTAEIMVPVSARVPRGSASVVQATNGQIHAAVSLHQMGETDQPGGGQGGGWGSPKSPILGVSQYLISGNP